MATSVGEVVVDGVADEAEAARLSFTLKQLVRKLHVSEPAALTMAIIGKRYPASREEFGRTRLPGLFDEQLVGTRMKLKVPVTWETQVSLLGNIASTWEMLIDRRKLPFMAMLRNVKNMIVAGISEAHHDKVVRNLTNYHAVVASRQFPFQFFSAYDVLANLEPSELLSSGGRGRARNKADATAKGAKMNGRAAQGPSRAPTAALSPGGAGGVEGAARTAKAAADKLKKLTSRYRGALDAAVKIATRHNVKPIRGQTLLLCDVGDTMRQPCTAAKGLGSRGSKPREVLEVALLTALMCKYACEGCELSLYSDCLPRHEVNPNASEAVKTTILKQIDGQQKAR